MPGPFGVFNQVAGPLPFALAPGPCLSKPVSPTGKTATPRAQEKGPSARLGPFPWVVRTYAASSPSVPRYRLITFWSCSSSRPVPV